MKETHLETLEALETITNQINETRGLGFDDWDLDFYENLFKDKLKRDPTDVELFDMGQVSFLAKFFRSGLLTRRTLVSQEFDAPNTKYPAFAGCREVLRPPTRFRIECVVVRRGDGC